MRKSVSLLAISLLALAGCSAQAEPSPTNTAEPDDAPTAITVGVSPSLVSLPIYAALEEEFAEENLDVTLAELQSGAESIPRLLSGDLAFAIGDVSGSIIASANGVEISILTPLTLLGTTPENDFSAIITDDPAIVSATDLEGRTVAVNQLQGTAELVVRAAIDAEGGDSERVQFVELPFPQMADSVSAGNVDAAMLLEPFLQPALAAGMTEVMRPGHIALPGGPSVVAIASYAYAQENPEIAERFVRAVNSASARLNGDTAHAREVLVENTQTPAELAERVAIPPFAETPDTDGVLSLIDLMEKYQALPGQPNLDQLLSDPASR